MAGKLKMKWSHEKMFELFASGKPKWKRRKKTRVRTFNMFDMKIASSLCASPKIPFSKMNIERNESHFGISKDFIVGSGFFFLRLNVFLPAFYFFIWMLFQCLIAMCVYRENCWMKVINIDDKILYENVSTSINSLYLQTGIDICLAKSL